MRMTGLAVLALALALTSNGMGQETCNPFGGTLYGWNTGKAWVGDGDFTIGRKVLHATVSDVNTGVEKHGDMWWGTETATFDFGKGSTVDLLTEFTTEHMADASGVFHVNEIGTFANGKGQFRNAYGHFNSQGPFGTGVVLPAGKAKPPAGVKMFWIGQYDGTICGVGK